MVRKIESSNDRARKILAQEAARIIAEHGVDDYRAAKIKAAERLGLTTCGSLPGNNEIEKALADHLVLFHGDAHIDLLCRLRTAAISAMHLLSSFAPRLVGPVLNGTAAIHSTINLHVFSDCAEHVADQLLQHQIACKLFERRLKSRRGHVEAFSGYQFTHEDAVVEATVFPFDGIRQAPISPVDGKPMRRADEQSVRAMIV